MHPGHEGDCKSKARCGLKASISGPPEPETAKLSPGLGFGAGFRSSQIHANRSRSAIMHHASRVCTDAQLQAAIVNDDKLGISDPTSSVRLEQKFFLH